MLLEYLIYEEDAPKSVAGTLLYKGLALTEVPPTNSALFE